MNPQPHSLVVVMGVSGCGKSTVGQALADSLHLPFVEGDSLHPCANVAKMAAGQALSDEDRWGWLQDIGLRLGQAEAARAGLVVSCSALKRNYRDRLRASAKACVFVHLQGSKDLLEKRLRQRQGHYMPATLLQSQLDALQPLQADEAGLTLDVAADSPALVAAAQRYLSGN